jgi:hypothetical protein
MVATPISDALVPLLAAAGDGPTVLSGGKDTDPRS